MKKNISAIVVAACVAGSANAGDFSFTGNFEHDDEVQEFHFTVVEPAVEVTLRTWSYAGGTNAAGADIAAGGFDPIVALFNASGQLLSQNDDGSPVLDPGSGSSWDSLMSPSLAAGDYTATVTQFSNFANGPTLAGGFDGSGHMDFSGRDSHWALDILNANSASLGATYISAISPIPEPESYALLLAGLGLVAIMKKRQLGVDRDGAAA